MPKLGLGMQIVFAFFILSLLINGISSYMLLYIKKTAYGVLWEEDKKKATFFTKPEGIAIKDAVWGKAQWVRENKRASFWLLIYKISGLSFLLFLGLPFILALFGIYLFD